MKTLFIIDASGFLYRSYFAIRNITNAKGESTNALYGFIRSVQKLRKDFHPDHLVAVFDGPRGTLQRKKIYPEYKANRSVTPPDLIYQIDWARQVCDLMGIPFLSVPEVEADDTIGSIAVWAGKQDTKVYLCSSDKDLAQLVNENVMILNTHKDNLILGPREVEETYGVPPEQIIDLLAMTGDSSDNVPGLPGFGPKTSVSLLKEFRSLDYILQNPDVVSGKKKETILQFSDQALLSRQLVTIHTSVDFPQEESFFAIRNSNLSPLKEFYTSMNFNSLIRELEHLTPSSQTEASTLTIIEESATHTLVDDEEAFLNLIDRLSKHKEVFVSTKATDPKPFNAELIGLAFCVDSQEAWYIPANGQLGLSKVIKGVKELFANPEIHFCGHNIKYDYQVLANYDVFIASISFDTMLASYLLNSHVRQHTLDHLALEHFGKIKPTVKDLLGKGQGAMTFATASLMHMCDFCSEEIDYIFRLKNIFEKQLEVRKLTSLLKDLELPLLTVLAFMEQRGIYLDVNYLTKMSTEVVHQIGELEQEIYSLAGETFNINSPKQLSHILFEKIGLKPPKKTATGLSTNSEVLESLSHLHPLPAKIQEYRVLEKLRSTYLDTLINEVNPKTHRIHCTFNQMVTATGRLSCQDPNLQNIPIRTEIGRKIRGAFRPQKEGWSYLAADYSQIELRLLAHLCEDPALISAFQHGEDIHVHTAAHIFNVPLKDVTKEMRYNAKAVNFGIIYGQQAFGLSQEIGVTVEEANLFIKMYFKQYPRVKEYVEECRRKARETGRAVTYTGRERLIPEINSKNGMIRAAAERLAINTPLQGTAADLIKMAMLAIDQRLKKERCESYMILQVHDELIFEIPDIEIEMMQTLVREMMQEVLVLKVPLVVDITIGKNWAEC